MRSHLSVRTLSTLTANIGQTMLALLTASGNRAKGQSLLSLESSPTPQTVHEHGCDDDMPTSAS